MKPIVMPPHIQQSFRACIEAEAIATQYARASVAHLADAWRAIEQQWKKPDGKVWSYSHTTGELRITDAPSDTPLTKMGK